MAEIQSSVDFEAFTRLDLRVATVKEAEFHPDADRLLRLQLDDGTESGRQVCAGVRKWYDPADLVGSQVVIVANLEPRTIRGEISEGMVLAATSANEDGEAGDVCILRIDRPVPPGSRVS